MAKISEVTRLEFADAIKPYQSKITAILSKEKTVLNAIAGGGKEAPYKKLMLCEDMIYVASLYMAQNSISLKILEVKNNDALNDARKILYKAIIYLEELVTNIIDIPYVDLAKNYEQIADYPVAKRFYLIRKLGLNHIDFMSFDLGDCSIDDVICAIDNGEESRNKVYNIRDNEH